MVVESLGRWLRRRLSAGASAPELVFGGLLVRLSGPAARRRLLSLAEGGQERVDELGDALEEAAESALRALDSVERRLLLRDRHGPGQYRGRVREGLARPGAPR